MLQSGSLYLFRPDLGMNQMIHHRLSQRNVSQKECRQSFVILQDSLHHHSSTCSEKNHAEENLSFYGCFYSVFQWKKKKEKKQVELEKPGFTWTFYWQVATRVVVFLIRIKTGRWVSVSSTSKLSHNFQSPACPYLNRVCFARQSVTWLFSNCCPNELILWCTKWEKHPLIKQRKKPLEVSRRSRYTTKKSSFLLLCTHKSTLLNSVFLLEVHGNFTGMWISVSTSTCFSIWTMNGMHAPIPIAFFF